MKYAIIDNNTVKEVVGTEKLIKIAYPEATAVKEVAEGWTTHGQTDPRFFDEAFNLKPLEIQVAEGLITLNPNEVIRDNIRHTLTQAEQWLENPTDTETLTLTNGEPSVQPLSLEEQYINGAPVEEALNEQIRQQRENTYMPVNGKQAGLLSDFYLGKITEAQLKEELAKLDAEKQAIKEELPYVHE